jgi:hypothetical protein
MTVARVAAVRSAAIRGLFSRRATIAAIAVMAVIRGHQLASQPFGT